jgi:hypothetical protein
MREVVVAFVANDSGTKRVLSVAKRLWDHVLDGTRACGVCLAEDAMHGFVRLSDSKATSYLPQNVMREISKWDRAA